MGSVGQWETFNGISNEMSFRFIQSIYIKTSQMIAVCKILSFNTTTFYWPEENIILVLFVSEKPVNATNFYGLLVAVLTEFHWRFF